MCGMVIYIQGLYKGTEREMIAITEEHLCNIEQSYKKKSFYFSVYALRLKSDDVVMNLQMWNLRSF